MDSHKQEVLHVALDREDVVRVRVRYMVRKTRSGARILAHHGGVAGLQNAAQTFVRRYNM